MCILYLSKLGLTVRDFVSSATGRIWTHGVGGGHRQNYRMVDFKRVGPKEGDPLVEKVLSVRYDPCRSADIAVVAGGEHKRYILASQNMKTGDLIKTSGKLTRMAGGCIFEINQQI